MDYHELLIQNVQKGEVYAVKLVDEPQVYTAIPMLPSYMQNDNEKFMLNILTPVDQKGVREYKIQDIEWIKRMG